MKKLLLCLFFVGTTLQAQKINYGLDLNSQYIWRGLQLDNAFSIQPTVELKVRNFTIGTWGNISSLHKPANEVDLYANYNFPVADMNLNVGVTDYMVAGTDKKFEFDNFDDDGAGQHILEANVKLTGPESFPATLQLNKNLYNDPAKTFHTAISYPVSVSGIDLVGTVGGMKFDAVATKVNAVDSFKFTELSLSAAKSFDFIKGHSTTFKVMGVYNPNAEEFYPVVGVSIWKASN